MASNFLNLNRTTKPQHTQWNLKNNNLFVLKTVFVILGWVLENNKNYLEKSFKFQTYYFWKKNGKLQRGFTLWEEISFLMRKTNDPFSSIKNSTWTLVMRATSIFWSGDSSCRSRTQNSQPKINFHNKQPLIFIRTA